MILWWPENLISYVSDDSFRLRTPATKVTAPRYGQALENQQIT